MIGVSQGFREGLVGIECESGCCRCKSLRLLVSQDFRAHSLGESLGQLLYATGADCSCESLRIRHSSCWRRDVRRSGGHCICGPRRCCGFLDFCLRLSAQTPACGRFSFFGFCLHYKFCGFIWSLRACWPRGSLLAGAHVGRGGPAHRAVHKTFCTGAAFLRAKVVTARVSWRR